MAESTPPQLDLVCVEWPGVNDEKWEKTPLE